MWVCQGLCVVILLVSTVYGLSLTDHSHTPGRAWPSENLLARGMVMRVRACDWLVDRYGRRSEMRRLLLTQTEPSEHITVRPPESTCF